MPELRPGLRDRADKLHRVIRQLEHHEVANVKRQHAITLCCPDWQDPRNVGAAFRLADAAGLAGLVLAGETPLPPNRKISKTARSCIRNVRWQATADITAYLNEQAAAGALILALEITTESHSLLSYTLPLAVRTGAQPLILIPGGEAAGVPPEVLRCCHGSVHLPMYGHNTSMNVAVATGAAVYLLLRQMQ